MAEDVLKSPKQAALDAIDPFEEQIAAAKAEVEKLYRQRDEAYIRAQNEGATIAEIAEHANTKEVTIKYMLGQAKKRGVK